MSVGIDARIEACMTVYASLLAQRDAHDANRRMVDLYALGGIGYYGGERVISRRYHLSDELDLTLRVLAVLRKRALRGDEKGLAERKRLTARADELREQLGLTAREVRH